MNIHSRILFYFQIIQLDPISTLFLRSYEIKLLQVISIVMGQKWNQKLQNRNLQTQGIVRQGNFFRITIVAYSIFTILLLLSFGSSLFYLVFFIRGGEEYIYQEQLSVNFIINLEGDLYKYVFYREIMQKKKTNITIEQNSI